MPKTNAVLLAGGESSRFGGDKSLLLPFAGMTLKRDFNLEKLFFNLNYPEDQKKAIYYLKEEADKSEKAETEDIY